MNRTILAAALLSSVLAGCATLGQASGSVKEYSIDQVVDLPADGIATVSLRSGPIEVTEVRVRNMPTAKDIAEDWRKLDTSRPKPIVTARNHGTDVAFVKVASILEDANGANLMECVRPKLQELPGGIQDDWNTCFMDSMRTADWPRVKRFHVKITARVRETTPAVVPAAAKE